MAKYIKNPNEPSAEDRALSKFAELMIDRIKAIDKDWQRPWFSDTSMAMPQNLNGRRYNGMNSAMLLLHCEKEGYKLPVFCTFDRVGKLNFQKDKDGNALPQVRVNKGEKSFPVFVTTYTCIDKDTKEKIPYEDYKKLSKEGREQYNIYPKSMVYNVFSVEQTNLAEARPELYAQLQERCKVSRPIQEGEVYSNAVLDAMVANNAWVCPIKPKHQEKAYYSISRDEIVIPEKQQFIDGQHYYGTMLHEMTHSTGAESRLNRLKACQFGDEAYSVEELRAELGSALVCQELGISKQIKEDSAAYLKAWLDNLQESPEFIKTVLNDVRKATAMISRRMEEVSVQLANGEEVRPYTAAEAAMAPEVVPSEAPFRDTEAAMATPGKERVWHEVDVMGLFNALKQNGEAKLSDHYINEPEEQEEVHSEDEEQTQSRGFHR